MPVRLPVADTDRSTKWRRELRKRPALRAYLEDLAANLPGELARWDEDARLEGHGRALDLKDERRVKRAAENLIAAIDRLRTGDVNLRYFWTDEARPVVLRLIERLDRFDANRRRFLEGFEASTGQGTKPRRGNPTHVRKQIIDRAVAEALEREGLPVAASDDGLWDFVLREYFYPEAIAERNRHTRRAPLVRRTTPPARKQRRRVR